MLNHYNNYNNDLGSKLKNDYSDNNDCKKGIKFDKNKDGSFFSFRPILSSNILQVTKNDNTNIMMLNSSGEVTFNNRINSPTITEFSNSISSHSSRITNVEQQIDTLYDRSTLHEFINATGAGFGNDFCNINLSNKYASIHKTCAFYLPAANFVNTPPGVPTNMSGIREVYWVDSNTVLVKLTEIHPDTGRCFYNAYIKNNWTGWKVF